MVCGVDTKTYVPLLLVPFTYLYTQHVVYKQVHRAFNRIETQINLCMYVYNTYSQVLGIILEIHKKILHF